MRLRERNKEKTVLKREVQAEETNELFKSYQNKMT